MKNACITFLVIAIILLSAVGLTLKTQTPHEGYLRIHIRANSDVQTDQTVKYAVKDAVVNYLTPVVSTIHTKRQAKATLLDNLGEIELVVETTLKENGFNYGAKVSLKSEQFPTRVYGDFTLEKGIYDALIIELGSGTGKNWWCVVYPPLCFTGGGTDYNLQSKIVQIIKEFKQRIKEGR